MSKKLKLNIYLTLYTIVKSKWIKDLEICLETTKYPEENINRMLKDLDL